MKKFLRENSLSIVLFSLFFVFLVGLGITGYMNENEEMAMHSQPAVSFIGYITSGSFVEAVFENWESEFLSVGLLLVLSIYLRQRGSPESKCVGESNQKTGS